MVSFCEIFLIGGSNIYAQKGFDLVLLPDYFCSFRYLEKNSRLFLSRDNNIHLFTSARSTKQT